MSKPVHRWALEWRSVNALDGERRHLISENCIPALFTTRAAARAFAQKRYGYIKHRPDLQQEPHGWRFPQPVRVTVQVSEPHTYEWPAHEH